jgi:hypothetical protein
VQLIRSLMTPWSAADGCGWRVRRPLLRGTASGFAWNHPEMQPYRYGTATGNII